MSELRISLVVIGILVIVAVYAAARLAAGRRGGREAARMEPAGAASAPESERFDEPEFEVRVRDSASRDDTPVGALSPSSPIPAFAVKKNADVSGEAPRASYAVARPVATPRRDVDAVAVPRDVVTLNVVARSDAPFRGDAIRRALVALGLELGERNLFHCYETDADGARATVFLVANMLKPGTFDPATLDALTTRGLSLFMQVPGPLPASEAFELMLERAGSIAVRLGGTVCDEQRVPMSPQRAREIRERLLSRDFAHAVPRDGAVQRSRH